MNASSPHILIVHADAHQRRVLAMLLVEAGLKVRAVEPAPDTAEVAETEVFDLILVGYQGMGEAAFELAGDIRERIGDEPPVIMLLPELELTLVVHGIRQGLSDVWPLNEDAKPVVRRVLALVMPERVRGVTSTAPIEMNEVEQTLQEIEPILSSLHADEEAVAMRERFRAALQELQGERDLVKAAQAAIDERARMLADERAALNLQRQALADDRNRVERAREELREERILWEDTLNDLQARETNLREYEGRLRERETELDTAYERTSSRRVSRSARGVMRSEADWDQAWEALNRAREVFEAEKAVFRDERMVLNDLDHQIKVREERLREIERQMADKDRVRRGLPPPSSAPAYDAAKQASSASPFKPTGRIRGIFTRKPPPPPPNAKAM